MYIHVIVKFGYFEWQQIFLCAKGAYKCTLKTASSYLILVPYSPAYNDMSI